MADASPVQEGTVIAEEHESGGEAEGAEVEGADGTIEPKTEGSGKPSNTLFLRNVPEEMEASELEMRLTRHGDLVSLTKEGEGASAMFVAKFHKTNSAYQAREKLNGSKIYENEVKVEFGPQDADHYNRGKKRTQGRGKKEFLDSGAVTDLGRNQTKKGSKAGKDGEEDPESSKRKADGEADEAPKPVEVRTFGNMVVPPTAISRWSETLTFEEQLEDFMKMPRRGMYNRYLVLGKLPPELRTGSAIWNMVAPVQRDIMHIEMITCFGKPVSHVALRSATAAAAMHRIAEQLHPNLTVAFAPPRKASKALWLGNVDDFVKLKDLEAILNSFGKTVHGMRYMPMRTCAFVTYTEVEAAVKARNFLYGLEVQKNQYLNVDFVDEWAAEAQEAAWGVPGMPMPPWGAPPMGPWGAAPGPWGVPPGAPMAQWQQQGQKGGRRGGEDQWGRGMPGYPGMPQMPGHPGMRAFPPDVKEDGKKRRSRSARRRGEPSEEPKRKKGAAASSPTARRAPARQESEEEEKPKMKVKLYKMGEFCCNIVANFVSGKENPDPFVKQLHIDQRTKIEHCKSHLDRAGKLATIWHFSAADRKDCAAYDALCDYFVEKERVGLVQAPSCYVYIVPPTEKYLKELGLPSSNFVVGLQIPIKK